VTRRLFDSFNKVKVDSSDTPGLKRFFNYYFPISFLAVAAFGIVAWNRGIQSKKVIPPVILFNAFLLVPKLVVREIVLYTTVIAYPFIVIINYYEVSVSLSCWYFILINLFLISLFRKNFFLFAALCIVHMTGLSIIAYVQIRPDDNLWYVSILTGYLTCALLMYLFRLFLLNLRLIKEKEMTMKRDRNLASNLQSLIKSVLHDFDNWTTMSKLGLEISQKDNKGVNRLIEKGVKGANELSLRLKAVLESNKFAYLRKIPLPELSEMTTLNFSDILPVEIKNDDGLSEIVIFADKEILDNCFMNLFRNAKQAGATRIELEFVKDPDDTIAVFIKDNGKGVPEGIVEKLFKNRVESAEKKGSGTGLVGVKYNLQFMNCKIELVEPNTRGDKETIFRISGIKLATDQYH
jgi:signal transduction histidine kinase